MEGNLLPAGEGARLALEVGAGWKKEEGGCLQAVEMLHNIQV